MVSTEPQMRIARVANDYSNFLAVLAIDATHVGAWLGATADGRDDFTRATHALLDDVHDITVGAGAGVVVEIGGCGLTQVHRVGDVLVMVEHYAGESDAEVALDAAILSTPTTDPVELGTVHVESGVLALVSLLETGITPPRAVLDAVWARGAVDTSYGALVALPPGDYVIWSEEFAELEGDWGSIERRVRIVPQGTPVVGGEPIAWPSPAPPPRAATVGGRRVVDRWRAVRSLALTEDGRVFAGESGGYRVCAWAADGTFEWARMLAPTREIFRHRAEVPVQFVGNELLALATDGLHVLDPATGATRRTIIVPHNTRNFRVSPDGTRLALRVGVAVQVLAYPQARTLGMFPYYCNQNWIAMAGDWLAVAGHEIHTFDLATMSHVATFEPPASPWSGCFTPDLRLLTGDANAGLRLWDPATGAELAYLDAARDRGRATAITSVAASTRHLAAARADGTVVLLDHEGTVLHTFDKHGGTDATVLSDVAFSQNGHRLWVSAVPAYDGTGLSVYDL